MNRKIIVAVFLFSLTVAAFTGCKGKSSAAINYPVQVKLQGGSGKAKLQSPAIITERNNRKYIQIVFNSNNYDYVIVNGKKYLNEAKSGNSTFNILISNFTDSFEMIADTTAMSRPHEIKYVVAIGISDEESVPYETKVESAQDAFPLKKTGAINFKYANKLFIEKYGNLRLITIKDSGRFLVVPEGEIIPETLPSDIVILQQPLNKCYMVSTSAMDFISKLNLMNHFSFSSLKENDWYIPEAQVAMKNGSLVYAGKYNTPDYEKLYSENCGLALENTMLLHNPETKEKLEELGIPVMIERSTYESNPLGRLEWIKLYGTLFNKEDEAESFYESQLKKLEPVLKNQSTGKTVCFFYVTSNGAVNVRKPEDYIAQMIEAAGGVYVPEGIMEIGNSTSTANIQMESFYAGCVDSDILIYNGTIDSSVFTLKDLYAKDQLFKDFKAIKNQKAYYVEKRLFQETTGLADFILDLNKILKGDESNLVYIRGLK